MKRIIILGMTSIVGGVETYILNIYNRFKSKYLIDFIIQEPLDGIFKEKFKNENCNFFVVGNLKRHPISTLRKLKKIYKNNHYDIAYVNLCNSSLFLYTFYLKKYNKNCMIITHSHNGDDKHKLQHKIIRKYLNKKTDKYFTCSDIAGNWMFGEKVMRSGKVHFIKNAIDTKKFEFQLDDRNEIRNALNIPKDAFVVGHIGRFEYQKNHPFILRLCEDKELSNIYFLLIGDGSYREEMLQQINSKDLHNVILPGTVENPYKYYSAMDCFILPSFFEGLPIVGIEAQANGLSCLFSDRISLQADVTGRCQFLDLKEDVWKQKILELSTRNINVEFRKEGRTICVQSGYDLDYEIEKIQAEF
ncbi:MAG: glycosyltransferase [Anaeroplasmataceae bacterium]|nr:glycosyltransferase [Anaeroplasmataceae bacterium]MDE6414482.1 glycosyltransferase [Anaeroplasmataceae bacterium]